MNNTLLQDNKRKLVAEQMRLKKMLGHDSTENSEIPGGHKPNFMEVGTEQGENASEVEKFANDLSLSGDLSARLKKVEAALARIEDGTYGKCAMGDEISEARLLAEPAAETCIDHAK
jgi:RNA polymerase-binding transcription factor DksA